MRRSGEVRGRRTCTLDHARELLLFKRRQRVVLELPAVPVLQDRPVVCAQVCVSAKSCPEHPRRNPTPGKPHGWDRV
eukprot:3936277-Rhodomonas_salina.2